jgi:drug/metabolite transporter (DMT)-like permease
VVTAAAGDDDDRRGDRGAWCGAQLRRRRDVRPTTQLTAGAVLLLPVAVASGAPGTPSFGALVALVAVGTLSTALPWPIYMRLLSETTPTIASTVTFVVPAFAIAWGSMVLSEPIGPELVAGFGLVIVSLVLVTGIQVAIPPLDVRSRLRHLAPSFDATRS